MAVGNFKLEFTLPPIECRLAIPTPCYDDEDDALTFTHNTTYGRQTRAHKSQRNTSCWETSAASAYIPYIYTTEAAERASVRVHVSGY